VDDAGAAVDVRRAHRERAQQPEDGVVVGFDEQAVLDAPHAVDECDRLQARGRLGADLSPVAGLDRRVDRGRDFFIQLDKLERALVVGRPGIEPDGVSRCPHAGSLWRAPAAPGPDSIAAQEQRCALDRTADRSVQSDQ
jgi:hypothetical protein